MNIINLHCYTANGSLESIIRNEQLINLKHPWVSVIDPYMFNVVDFLRDCDRSGKIPVIGLDSYVAFGKVDQLKISYGQIFGRYSLIAYNSIGYYNLVRLMTFGYISGLYSKPRIDFDVLSIYNEGILCLINSAHSTISYHLNNQQNNLAIQEILLLKEIFGDKSEIIASIPKDVSRDNQVTGDDIVAYLKRRPGTADDISLSLGAEKKSVEEILFNLERDKTVVNNIFSGKSFWEYSGNTH